MSSNSAPLSVEEQVMMFFLLAFFGYYFWVQVSNWQELTGTLRYAALFYYHAVAWPISKIFDIWIFMQNFTSFKALNIILGVISCTFFSMLFLGFYGAMKGLIDSKVSPGTAVNIFCLPAILAFIVWVFN